MLKRACKRLVGRLSWKQSHFKKTSTATATATAESVVHAAASSALQEPGLAAEHGNRRSASPEADVPVQNHPADVEHGTARGFVPPVRFEDWSTPYLHIHRDPDSVRAASSGNALVMYTVVRNPSSESDSGVGLDDAALRMASEEQQ